MGFNPIYIYTTKPFLSLLIWYISFFLVAVNCAVSVAGSPVRCREIFHQRWETLKFYQEMRPFGLCSSLLSASSKSTLTKPTQNAWKSKKKTLLSALHSPPPKKSKVINSGPQIRPSPYKKLCFQPCSPRFFESPTNPGLVDDFDFDGHFDS